MYKDMFATSPKAVNLLIELVEDFNLCSELEARLEWIAVHAAPDGPSCNGNKWYTTENELGYVRGEISIIRKYLERLAHLTGIKIHFKYGAHTYQAIQEDLYYRTVDIEYEE